MSANNGYYAIPLNSIPMTANWVGMSGINYSYSIGNISNLEARIGELEKTLVRIEKLCILILDRLPKDDGVSTVYSAATEDGESVSDGFVDCTIDTPN